MTDEDALIRACLAAPADRAPRLILADWLDERGREAEAKTLRHGGGKAFHHDKDRVRFVFRALRRRGYFARMGWKCCQGCGWSAIRQGTERVVFYHQQDAEAFDRHGDLYRPLYLSHRGPVGPVLTALLAAGLGYQWDGSVGTRIAATGAPAGLG